MFKKIILSLFVLVITFVVYLNFSLLFTIKQYQEINLKLNSIIIQQNEYIIKNTKGKWI